MASVSDEAFLTAVIVMHVFSLLATLVVIYYVGCMQIYKKGNVSISAVSLLVVVCLASAGHLLSIAIAHMSYQMLGQSLLSIFDSNAHLWLTQAAISGIAVILVTYYTADLLMRNIALFATDFPGNPAIKASISHGTSKVNEVVSQLALKVSNAYYVHRWRIVSGVIAFTIVQFIVLISMILTTSRVYYFLMLTIYLQSLSVLVPGVLIPAGFLVLNIMFKQRVNALATTGCRSPISIWSILFFALAIMQATAYGASKSYALYCSIVEVQQMSTEIQTKLSPFWRSPYGILLISPSLSGVVMFLAVCGNHMMEMVQQNRSKQEQVSMPSAVLVPGDMSAVSAVIAEA
ncbi:hypothetical protein MIR68_010032 [Amoeboaphelidium protococcarum]|nr:hypothetical protein MIR68_010032 [Amoeboaphelidium protococcarum]